MDGWRKDVAVFMGMLAAVSIALIMSACVAAVLCWCLYLEFRPRYAFALMVLWMLDDLRCRGRPSSHGSSDIH